MRKPLARNRFATAAVATGLMVVFLPGLAEAQSTLSVLGIRSHDGDDEFSRNLTGVLRHSAEQIPSWQVTDREVALDQALLAYGCEEANEACMAEVAGSLESDLILYGEVRRTSSGEHYDFSINLFLYNRANNSVDSSVAETIPGIRTDVDDLRAPVRRFVLALSGAPRSGTLRVATNVPEAQVFIDDTLVGTADSEGRLTVSEVEAGTRHVRVVADGHNSFTSTVSMEAYAESTFEAELVADGGGGGGGVSGELLVGVGLLGVGAAAAGLWVWSMTVVDGVNNASWTGSQGPRSWEFYRSITPVGTTVCEEHTRNEAASEPEIGRLCSTGQAHEVLQFVFLGTAAVSAGLGAYFLATSLMGDDGEDAEAMRLVPTFAASDQGGHVGLVGVF